VWDGGEIQFNTAVNVIVKIQCIRTKYNIDDPRLDMKIKKNGSRQV
jgi:hypothetical protein